MISANIGIAITVDVCNTNSSYPELGGGGAHGRRCGGTLRGGFLFHRRRDRRRLGGAPGGAAGQLLSECLQHGRRQDAEQVHVHQQGGACAAVC